MTMFIIITFIWLALGFIGLLRMNKNQINFCFLIFMLALPFFPIIASACGIM